MRQGCRLCTGGWHIPYQGLVRCLESLVCPGPSRRSKGRRDNDCLRGEQRLGSHDHVNGLWVPQLAGYRTGESQLKLTRMVITVIVVEHDFNYVEVFDNIRVSLRTINFGIASEFAHCQFGKEVRRRAGNERDTVDHSVMQTIVRFFVFNGKVEHHVWFDRLQV